MFHQYIMLRGRTRTFIVLDNEERANEMPDERQGLHLPQSNSGRNPARQTSFNTSIGSQRLCLVAVVP